MWIKMNIKRVKNKQCAESKENVNKKLMLSKFKRAADRNDASKGWEKKLSAVQIKVHDNDNRMKANKFEG